MTEIFGYNTGGIGKGILSNLKWDSMPLLVLLILLLVPFEAHYFHDARISKWNRQSNINIHMMIWL